MAVDRVQLAILVALSLLPPLLYAGWLRNRERRGREPWVALLRAFVYGGTLGAGVALLLHVLFDIGFAQPNNNFGLDATFLGVIIVAPIVEEFGKGLGLASVRRHMGELENGLIYGAALGLGFAATENFIYGISTLTEDGATQAFSLVVVRVFSSMLLHAGASGLLGFGYALHVGRGGAVFHVIPYYLVAVLLHATFNYLVSSSGLAGFFMAILMVFMVAWLLGRRIEQLDRLPHQKP